MGYRSTFLMIRAALAGVVLCVAGGCASKVGNPNNDADQVPEAELLSYPAIDQKFRIPDQHVDFENIDPSFHPILADMLAVARLAAAVPSDMSKFFAALGEKKLRKNKPFTLETADTTLTGRTWTNRDSGALDAGIYFCVGTDPVGYFQWGEGNAPVTYYRDYRWSLITEDDPLLKGLDGRTKVTFNPDGSLLASRYSGQRRDLDTMQPKLQKAVVNFTAKVEADGSYTTQGGSANLDDDGTIPQEGELKAYGSFNADATGEVLIHLNGLCPAFVETDADNPKWCLNAKLSQNAVTLGAENPDERWKVMRRPEVPMPTFDQLQVVSFPPGMTCPE